MSLSGRAKCLFGAGVKNFVYVIGLPSVRIIGPNPYAAVEDDPPPV